MPRQLDTHYWFRARDGRCVNLKLRVALAELAQGKALPVATNEGWMHERVLKSKGG